MNLNEFSDKVCAAMRSYMADTAEVTVNEVSKNNGLTLKGLTVRRTDLRIAPTIYLEQFYEEYENGKSFSEIMKYLFHFFEEYSVMDIEMDFFTDYEKVKKRIIFKLVNRELNEELLKEVPYQIWNDLAIVFAVLLEIEGEGNGTILIRNEHLKMWSITNEELYLRALDNTPDLCGEYVADLKQYVTTSEEPGEMDGFGYTPCMYVLSNKQKIFGATTILYSRTIETLAEKYKSNVLIIPSSIHEILLLPEVFQNDYSYMKQTIREVNATQVTLEERLSDNLYYYDYESGDIKIA